ncbi:MAG: LexA repressor [Pelotomaculum sp. PtaU1.Bin065]|nr:MAG: LexA repressor [Pelotomaculum sp. PtaU1.Bin065]
MFNKDKFAKLLKEAIGDRTTTVYADIVDVNRTYISKILNKKLLNPPGPEVIKKLASKAYHHITYEDFMVAAGWLPEAYSKTIEHSSHEDRENIAKSEDIKDFNELTYDLPSDAIPIGETTKIPVLRIIRADLPLYADQHIIEYVDVPVEEVKGGEYFYFIVTGDCMTGSRIYPGDRVFVRRQEKVENGEIAIVTVNKEEAKLKRVKFLEEAVILYPDNPKYQPQIYNAQEIRIVGKIVKVEFKP